MEFYISKKKPLTDEQKQWCYEALKKAEPYPENESVILDAPIDIDRLNATRAKEMLERGWN